MWESERLVAVLPLCVHRYRGVRILEWIAARISDYCGALVHPGVDEDAVLLRLWEFVMRGGGFDIARLSHVRTDTRLFAVLSNFSPWIETAEDASGVPIAWKSGAEWLERQSASMRERVRYKARGMRKAGFEVHVCPSSAFGTVIDVLVAQKRQWLAERNASSFIEQSAGVEFLKSAVAAAAARDELRLTMVENAGRIGAVNLAFVRDGIIYCYMASFDPAFQKYSFGRILTDTLLMWAADNGMRRLDLLLGSHDYKTEYGCTLEPVRTLVMARSLIGRAALLLYRRYMARTTQA